ncbi:hypothetical protein BGZ99_000833 [Dissophora globulifera]|uniref:FAD-binding domain-containing protein n=1 Tax=Dissophora globulifera TaxID=979702 RepID=A0A9P6R2K4_9FUNG|nr:hypothetical protein BGZ99_000833 [Dissophora globulifera]
MTTYPAGSSGSSTQPDASSNPSTSTVPVLIVGAGPIGLFEAYLLTKQGVQVRIIEREMAFSPLNKAIGIHSRTMEILQMSGLVDRFLERGLPMTDFTFFMGAKKAATIPLLRERSSTHYGYVLRLEQAKTCRILVEELEKLGVHVDYGWELSDTKVVEESGHTFVETVIRKSLYGENTRDEKKVIAEVGLLVEQAGKEYETQIVRSDYLVASDGGRSTVRHKLNIGFPGRTLNYKTMVWEGLYECEIDLAGMTFLFGENKKTLLAFTLSEGITRLHVEAGEIQPGEDMSKLVKEITVEKFEELANAAIAPAKIKLTKTTLLTMYRCNERRAENFVHKNRIFLVGDAAHAHSPIGAQGMNTGLQDAHNLAWKLALVLNKVAPEALLETYREREAMADRAIALSSRLLHGIKEAGMVPTIKRTILFALSPILIALMKFSEFEPDVSMLSVQYQENALNKAHATQSAPAAEFQVGVRAQDGNLRPWQAHVDGTQDLPSIRLHELTAGINRFHIIVFASDMLYACKDTAGTTTSAKELRCNIEEYLPIWRSKWSYASDMQDNQKDKDIFKVHVIAGWRTLSDSKGSTDDNSNNIIALADKRAGDGKIYVDDTKVLHQRYGFACGRGTGGIVVIRPDSHIGYRVNGAGEQAWKDVHEYFNSILTN